MMTCPMYASYPYVVCPPSYNNFLGSRLLLGQGYGNYYGYVPWVMQPGNPGGNNSSVVSKSNGVFPNYQRMGYDSFYPQYSTSYYYPWSANSLTNWYYPQQPCTPMAQWGAYYNSDKWNPMNMNFNYGAYYSWPLMSYYHNQMMFPNYLSPSPTYWGVQRTIEMPQTVKKQTTTAQETLSESKTLNVTSSEVIRDFNLPPAVAKKTRSDIPRPTAYTSEVKDSDKSKDDMETPFLFRVSDTSIKQIASSRSFGPSMVYNTESDNRPRSSQWSSHW